MSALREKARDFANLYNTRPASRSSGTWANLCGILMIQFGGHLGGATAADIKNRPTVAIPLFWNTAPSGDVSQAIIVARNSGWLNPDASKAPIGAWHFWTVPGVPAGHVGQDLDGGGTAVFMATDACAEKWGDHLGVQSVAGYSAAKKATYLGWSTNYRGGTVKLPSEDPAVAEARKAQVRKIAAFLNLHASNLGRKPTNATIDGVPGERYWTLVQALGKAWGFYGGVVDGKPGNLTYNAEAHIWTAYVNVAPPPAPVEPAPQQEPEKPAEPEPDPVEQPEPEKPTDPEQQPEPEGPVDPDPEQEEPVAETPEIEVPVKVKFTDEKLASLLAIAETKEPAEPVIPDKPAKVLWVVLSLIAVSSAPVVALTVLDWQAWDAQVGGQFATTVTAWAGSVAAVLGLSRYAKSKS